MGTNPLSDELLQSSSQRPSFVSNGPEIISVR